MGRKKQPSADARASSDSGRFAYEGLDRTIHEKARLGIMSSLATHPSGLVFNDLKQLCSLTDGNLNRHLLVLEEAKLVEIRKGIENNRPQTVCRITRLGRERLLEYIRVLESVVADAAAAEAAGRSAAKASKARWSLA